MSSPSLSRRPVVLAVGIALAATSLVVAGVSGPAAAAPAASAATSAIVSGEARFEVLSPTLIRTEYAGDAHFVDAPTFNAVGRDTFTRTRSTVKTVGGWLTIDTDAMQLRYKVGSGAFTSRNLTMTVANGAQTVKAAPWPDAISCQVGVLCEAEDLDLDGPGVASDHSGATGRGFAAGFEGTGDQLSFRTTVTRAGAYDFDARYANYQGGDGQITTRTLTVTVDGGAPQKLSLPPTANWDSWQLAMARLTLTAGAHTVALVRGASDSGSVNVDSLALVRRGGAYPTPVPAAAVPCAFAKVCEADQGTLTGGARLGKDHNGYSGPGFLAGLENTGSSDTLTVTGVPRAGRYALQVRYANYAAGAQAVQARDVSVRVGDAAATTATLAPTSSWDAWRTVSTPVVLAAGTNTVTLGCPTVASCNINVDTVAFTPAGGALLAPHAGLGGYRRGLDGVDGSALTTPGLLYADGWSLLDDSASALWSAADNTVTPRQVAAGYQDGYVFGYGQDYPAALADLSTLTGPTALLPRWTYGVGWSEYYDRTAAQYEQLVAKFRAEGVPLDALIIDTDFKTPNQWNGWGIDATKFPDPAAFFAWAKSQGLHTSLNIHPSIEEADPAYAAAQATAGGALAPGACGGGAVNCHVFDWGDPAQLAAYFDLHKPAEADGVDFWWLDWCCDSTNASSLQGVTPDSWINEQYARDTAPRTGRGFAFSRAYGSLQAGGYGSPTPVPTGPWADKRTTLHFTGDTTSDWQTLAFEVGYTPGESVATGLAAISHDIGGHTGGLQEPGVMPGETKLPDDLYARWVQLGTFQPIDRLHSNHSTRLPWDYGTAADASATAFLNLRERLVPYTYSLAHQATTTGTPIVRPLYLQYPGEQEAYAQASSEYLYGPDVLVAPVTTPGASSTSSVWFPPGSTWTDWFTGKTYQGGTTAKVTTNLSTMPVFIRSGGVVVTRTDNVAGDTAPLSAATVTVAEGANGSTTLYEDDGTTTDLTQSATTTVRYQLAGRQHRVTIERPQGTFDGQVAKRAWTVTYANATAPTTVTVNGVKVTAASWTYSNASHRLTVRVPAQTVTRDVVVQYS